MSWTSKTGPLPPLDDVQRMLGRVASALRPSKKSRGKTDSSGGKGDGEEERPEKETEDNLTQEEILNVQEMSQILELMGSDNDSDSE